ncbi:MurR/RpiR family transcriptional regulator [Paenibacillus xerothermodurans]|uniref:MurR/RpiR family transcriptional regulator n=1 Tax=Paenibacillus xerothermodurans TaxID=1977292 RepID=A0A2W1N9Q3_PAEXE|nr:MurR/RpiR family transcriptional regulator [Paenibacillus xerothermodurans]PZE21147.1 MurR/RpiR family transcriptional regulator [Paenibacillus xerothermodurans]
MRFEERVQKFEYKLNDTDDQIVEYIIKNKKDTVQLSIQSLAAKLFTVPNTVTRLSKKLGYDGFSQLKNRLKDELQTTDRDQVADNLHHNIQRTLSLLDPEKIAMVNRMIQDAGRVLFFGVGDSLPFCEMMVKHLKIVGKAAEYYIHRHEMIHEISHLTGDDLIFFISLSGETPQVLEMAELCRQRGVAIVSLTHFSRNSLQQLAVVNLYCYSPKLMLNEHNITDKTPLMIVIRLLSEHYWNLSSA